MATVVRRTLAVLLALWRAWWCSEPRYCLRHRLAMATGRVDLDDHGSPLCPRCKLGEPPPVPPLI